MNRYMARVERSSIGSLHVVLCRDEIPFRTDPVRSLRHGKRHAYDLLCSVIATDPDAAVDARPAGQEKFADGDTTKSEMGL